VFFLLLVLVLVPDCLMVLGIELLLAFVLFFLLLFSLFFGGGVCSSLVFGWARDYCVTEIFMIELWFLLLCSRQKKKKKKIQAKEYVDNWKGVFSGSLFFVFLFFEGENSGAACRTCLLVGFFVLFLFFAFILFFLFL
jgi:hypothetical protein